MRMKALGCAFSERGVGDRFRQAERDVALRDNALRTRLGAGEFKQGRDSNRVYPERAKRVEGHGAGY